MSSNTKQLPASKKKLRKAREDGDVAKSRDISSLAVLTIGICTIYYYGQPYAALREFLTKTLSETHDFHTNNVLVSLAEALGIIGLVVFPVLLFVFLGVLIIELLQVGVCIRFAQCIPKLSRIGIFSGFKRILGFDKPDSMPIKLPLEFLKLVLYFSILGAAIFSVLLQRGTEILGGAYRSVQDICDVLLEVSFSLSLVFLSAYTVLSFVDYGIIRWRRDSRLRMDPQEFKKELREAEGDAQTRGMRKQIHQELLQHQIVQSVRRARVIVVGESIVKRDD
jgi:flagellar biosynthesis protein FlhB